MIGTCRRRRSCPSTSRDSLLPAGKASQQLKKVARIIQVSAHSGKMYQGTCLNLSKCYMPISRDCPIKLSWVVHKVNEEVIWITWIEPPLRPTTRDKGLFCIVLREGVSWLYSFPGKLLQCARRQAQVALTRYCWTRELFLWQQQISSTFQTRPLQQIQFKQRLMVYQIPNEILSCVWQQGSLHRFLHCTFLHQIPFIHLTSNSVIMRKKASTKQFLYILWSSLSKQTKNEPVQIWQNCLNQVPRNLTFKETQH